MPGFTPLSIYPGIFHTFFYRFIVIQIDWDVLLCLCQSGQQQQGTGYVFN